MTYTSEIEQGSEVWHEWRAQGIGASEAPIIMGLGYITAHQLWEERVGVRPRQEQNFAMKRGTQLEPIARMEVEKLLGCAFHSDLRVHEEYNWMRCSLDGINDNGDILEIKCPNKERHSMALSGVIPMEYYPQVQHQIEVCGTEFGYYFSFNGESGKLLEIARDDDYIKRLVACESAFWDCLQNLEEPDLTDQDYVLREESDWIQASSDWMHANKLLKEYERLAEEKRQYLIKLANNTNCKGNGVKVCRTIRKGTVDYKAIPEIQGINLEQYRKGPVQSWRIGAA